MSHCNVLYNCQAVCRKWRKRKIEAPFVQSKPLSLRVLIYQHVELFELVKILTVLIDCIEPYLL